MIIEREFIRLGECTVKIGRTSRGPNDRIEDYPKRSKVILNIMVVNSTYVEKKLKESFNKKFKKMYYGNEYFQGNIRTMANCFMHTLIVENALPNCIINDIEINDSGDDQLNCTKNQPLIIQTSADNISIENNSLEQMDNINTQSDINNLNAELDSELYANESCDIVSTEPSRTLKSFYRYIYDMKPSWYKENTLIDIAAIEDAYRAYFDDQTTTKAVISRQLNGSLFKSGTRVNRVFKKKLVSYEELKTIS